MHYLSRILLVGILVISQGCSYNVSPYAGYWGAPRFGFSIGRPYPYSPYYNYGPPFHFRPYRYWGRWDAPHYYGNFWFRPRFRRFH
jgi:hypothetical protein